MAEKQEGGGERVALVGYHDDKVEVNYSVPNGNHREDRSLPKCSDRPGEGFIEAFEALTPFALEIARIKDAAWKSTARAIKLHVSQDPKSGRRGIVLTVYQPLEHGGIVFNTPVRQEKMEPTEVGAGMASAALMAAVQRVQAEALAYVRGQREQGELFPEDQTTLSAAGEAQPDISPGGERQHRRVAAKRGKAPPKKPGRGKRGR